MTRSSSVRRRSEESRVLDWQKDVARSTTTRAPQAQPSTTQIIVNNITTPKVIITHPSAHSRQDKEISTRAIIGTLIGVGAGAAVAYAMSNDEREDRQPQAYTSYPSNRVNETAIIIRSPLSDVKNYQPQRTSVSGSNRAGSQYSIKGPRIETVVSSNQNSRHSPSGHYRSLPPVDESHTGQTVVRTANGTKVLTGSKHSRSSHASTSRRRELEYEPSAAHVPLPESRASTLISRYDTVVPTDSISQVSTVRPRHREDSSRYEDSRYREESSRYEDSRSGKHRSNHRSSRSIR